MPLYALADLRPTLDASAWVAPGADVIGDVRLGADSSVWFGATIRGDNATVAIGTGSNIQDGAVLHADPGFLLSIGAGCTIGHGAVVHGCTIGDGTLVGMGATILNGATIGAGCLIGAGALITEGKAFAPGMLILGSPARAVRPLEAGSITRMRETAAGYIARAARYRHGLARID